MQYNYSCFLRDTGVLRVLCLLIAEVRHILSKKKKRTEMSLRGINVREVREGGKTRECILVNLLSRKSSRFWKRFLLFPRNGSLYNENEKLDSREYFFFNCVTVLSQSGLKIF